MRAHALNHPAIQASYRREYALLLKDLAIRQGSRVLDVGSGLGFLKPLVTARGGRYVGIEPDAASCEYARTLYGSDGYVLGFFPDAAPTEDFDFIIALSCVDEVPDKAAFLAGMARRLAPRTGVGYIAVRNRAFFVNRFKRGSLADSGSGRARISLSDLTAPEWERLIASSGLKIVESGKFWRPWLTGFSFTGVKNVFYRLVSMVTGRNGSYMVYFKVTT